MNFEDFFGKAKWIAPKEQSIYPILKQSFSIGGKIIKAEINIIGFGSFEAFINGNKIGNDWFLPLNTDYEKRELAPIGEETAFRTIVPHYDITNMLTSGNNILSVLLGNGWYTTRFAKNMEYGDIKAVWSIKIDTDKGTKFVFSNPNDVFYKESFVKYSELTYGEEYDYTDWNDDEFSTNTVSSFQKCIEAKSVLTNYEYNNCPADKIQKIIKPKLIKKDENGCLFDFGINTTGVPLIGFDEGIKGKVEIKFSENIIDGSFDTKHCYNQHFFVKNNGKTRKTYMRFTWVAARYAIIKGEFSSFEFLQINADIKPTSNFYCNNNTLNWLYKSYINSQLTNMHRGIPSDCPHIERRGYTGDGQLCASASMKSLNGYEFYKKWINDISDCQDRISGHVQYTAPYVECGGGPGGWGSAIVFVPYYFWKIYGDDRFLKAMYPQMLEYFRYLDNHSDFYLVTSDKKDQWCLGEWCTPNCFLPNSPVILPPSFVNNYFYIKALEKVIEIAEYIDQKRDIPKLKKVLDERKKATHAAYFNPSDNNYIGNSQGANAFALDMGLGNEETKKNFINHYKSMPYYDTGIFGTEIVTRLLFEYGEADTAIKILTASKPHGFGKWKKQGATTLFEEWLNPRSMNHPMFGAVINLFYTEILGIRQEKEGYENIVISPKNITSLTSIKGFVSNKYGKIKVCYKKANDSVIFDISIPKNTKAKLIYNNKQYNLVVGKNEITI